MVKIQVELLSSSRLQEVFGRLGFLLVVVFIVLGFRSWALRLALYSPSLDEPMVCVLFVAPCGLLGLSK